ncbi:MAG: hypothetical protein U0528_20790 [Anaerolineae bacterium]|nr:hypothetical protein [Anaerolineae bacterium]
MQPLTEQPDRERRLRIIVALVGVAVMIVLVGMCTTLFSVIPASIDFGYSSPTPDIPVTGTVGRIAGMTTPPDADVFSQQPRPLGGGTFDYRTRLRPQQIYNFYVATLELRGGWTPGQNQHILENEAHFRFYSTYVPRLSLFDVKCDAVYCTVHVDY